MIAEHGGFGVVPAGPGLAAQGWSAVSLLSRPTLRYAQDGGTVRLWRFQEDFFKRRWAIRRELL